MNKTAIKQPEKYKEFKDTQGQTLKVDIEKAYLAMRYAMEEQGHVTTITAHKKRKTTHS